MKIPILIIIYIFFIHTTYGQNKRDKTNTLKFEIGLNYIQLKDRTFSPIVLPGNAPKVNIEYNRKRNNTLWSIALSTSFGSINHSNNNFESAYISAQLISNYLRRLKSHEKSEIYFGGQFRSVLNILNYDGFASGSWYSAQQLEPILVYDYIISEKQSIKGQFHYPIFSLVARPTYAGIDEFVVVNSDNIPKIFYSRMKIYSLNKIINPNFELEYAYWIKKRMKLSISATYSYLQVNSIRKYYKNELGINVGVHLKIGKNNEE